MGRMVSRTAYFTGHRPKALWGYDEASRRSYRALSQRIRQEVERLYGSGYRTFISSGTQGADQVTFWAVKHLVRGDRFHGVKNSVYLPCKGYGDKWRDDGMFGKNEFRMMLDVAFKVRYVADRPYQNPGGMFARNHAMVDDSDLLVAIYGVKDDFHDANGGTAETMRYADKVGKEIIVINPFKLW